MRHFFKVIPKALNALVTDFKEGQNNILTILIGHKENEDEDKTR